MHKELSFVIPVLLDQKFKKCQMFCTSKLLSDLVGKNNNISFLSYNLLLAVWVSKELKKFESSVKVAKLNGDNSHQEKERITELFKQE